MEYRSKKILGEEDSAFARSLFKAMGYTDSELKEGKPLIGIANVFSNTLSFLQQRKREFARYISIGMTPAQMRKLFCAEAFVIAGRPIFITLPLTVVIVMLMISASYLDPMVFWREAPIFPIFLFALVIIGFVSLAYYIGGKQILECDLNEVLKNDAVI